MLRSLAAAGLALALAPAPASAQMTMLSPAQVGEVFCIARLGNDMAPVEALLAPALSQAIADAGRQNAAWETANPGEKPPLGDGIPWQTWPDYAPQCQVGATSLSGDRAEVEIDYAFPEAPEAGFTDRLQLLQVEVPGRAGPVWRIDNIAYAEGGDLRTALVESFAH